MISILVQQCRIRGTYREPLISGTLTIVTCIRLIKHLCINLWINIINHNKLCLLNVISEATTSTSYMEKSMWFSSLFDPPEVRIDGNYSTDHSTKMTIPIHHFYSIRHSSLPHPLWVCCLKYVWWSPHFLLSSLKNM